MINTAETRVPEADSCRTWNTTRARHGFLAAALAMAALAVAAPAVMGLTLLFVAVLALVANSALKATALVLALRPRDPATPAAAPTPGRPPVVSLLVPLFAEDRIASHLLARLDRLDYPADRLDICLILEEDDARTRAAIAAATLPRNAQVITVPRGHIQTKPRALNFALDFAKGSIIGIYDAEDAPEPDQISKVVQRFAERGPTTACLQGALDFYNTDRNWMARCFTLDYAAWFRVILPALSRLGFVIPLGGTTLFLRREAIEAVGGWDAHNVTEDADLGVRLARRGYETELIPSTTFEEANIRPWPWVRQRSRWLKGYALTYAVHMARPGRLLRDLGPWRFLGIQLLFLVTLTQLLLAPLLWSFWFVLFGLPHPITAWLPAPVITALALGFGLAWALSLATSVIAARRAGRPRLWAWAPFFALYQPLATLAMFKALWELARHPFFWDKTEHGGFGGAGPVAPAAIASPPAPHPA